MDFSREDVYKGYNYFDFMWLWFFSSSTLPFFYIFGSKKLHLCSESFSKI